MHIHTIRRVTPNTKIFTTAESSTEPRAAWIAAAHKAIRSTFAYMGIRSPMSVELLFVDGETIRTLNRENREKDSVTRTPAPSPRQRTGKKAGSAWAASSSVPTVRLSRPKATATLLSVNLPFWRPTPLSISSATTTRPPRKTNAKCSAYRKRSCSPPTSSANTKE